MASGSWWPPPQLRPQGTTAVDSIIFEEMYTMFRSMTDGLKRSKKIITDIKEEKRKINLFLLSNSVGLGSQNPILEILRNPVTEDIFSEILFSREYGDSIKMSHSRKGDELVTALEAMNSLRKLFAGAIYDFNWTFNAIKAYPKRLVTTEHAIRERLAQMKDSASNHRNPTNHPDFQRRARALGNAAFSTRQLKFTAKLLVQRKSHYSMLIDQERKEYDACLEVLMRLADEAGRYQAHSVRSVGLLERLLIDVADYNHSRRKEELYARYLQAYQVPRS